MEQEVKNFLSALGVTVPISQNTISQNSLLSYAVTLVEKDLMIGTNQNPLPEGMHDVWMYRAAGEYLSLVRDGLNLAEEFSVESSSGASNVYMPFVSIKKVQEGDTTVDFGNESSSKMSLTQVIDWLQHFGVEAIARWRKMVW